MEWLPIVLAEHKREYILLLLEYILEIFYQSNTWLFILFCFFYFLLKLLLLFLRSSLVIKIEPVNWPPCM